jgi:hypothetical protein
MAEVAASGMSVFKSEDEDDPLRMCTVESTFKP